MQPDQYDPTDDPRACDRCGTLTGGIRSDDYCDPCKRDIGEKPPMRYCDNCGQVAPEETMKQIDVSSPDEYYPTSLYICRSCTEG